MVNRYDMRSDGEYEEMVQDSMGEWVAHQDYIDLEAKLVVANEQAKRLIQDEVRAIKMTDRVAAELGTVRRRAESAEHKLTNLEIDCNYEMGIELRALRAENEVLEEEREATVEQLDDLREVIYPLALDGTELRVDTIKRIVVERDALLTENETLRRERDLLIAVYNPPEDLARHPQVIYRK